MFLEEYNMYIYADNAATTKMSNVALQAMLPYFTETFGNPSSLHSAGQEAKEALEAARATVAKCIGCEPREVYFTSGGSEADNQAIISILRDRRDRGDIHISVNTDSRCTCLNADSVPSENAEPVETTEATEASETTETTETEATETGETSETTAE